MRIPKTDFLKYFHDVESQQLLRSRYIDDGDAYLFQNENHPLILRYKLMLQLNEKEKSTVKPEIVKHDGIIKRVFTRVLDYLHEPQTVRRCTDCDKETS